MSVSISIYVVVYLLYVNLSIYLVTYFSIHVFIHLSMYLCIYVYIYMYIYIYTYIYIYMGKFLYLGPKAELRLFGEDAPTVRRVTQLVGVVYIRRPKCPDDTSTNLK